MANENEHENEYENEYENGSKKQSLEEWMAAERARLKQGFNYEPSPTSPPNKSEALEQVAAGLGVGAGVLGGALAPHPETVTFEGCRADVIVKALKSDIADPDTRIRAERSGESTIVTILQSQAHSPGRFAPALTVTLVESAETLTVNISALNQEAKRNTLGSVGRTVLGQGKRLLFRRRGMGGLFDTAGELMRSAENLVEDVQDLGLPKRVWAVIDRVGSAAEQTYLENRRKRQEVEEQREAAERAWLYCEYCGRAYEQDEETLSNCPACRGARGPKPDWLKDL